MATSLQPFARSEEHKLRYEGWTVAIFSAACIFVGFASMLVYTFGVFLKPLTAEFGWSRQSASAAFGIAALAVAACSPVLGILLDRYPARRIILPCMAIFGSAFFSLGFLTSHLAQLYVAFLLLGAPKLEQVVNRVHGDERLAFEKLRVGSGCSPADAFEDLRGGPVCFIFLDGETARRAHERLHHGPEVGARGGDGLPLLAPHLGERVDETLPIALQQWNAVPVLFTILMVDKA